MENPKQEFEIINKIIQVLEDFPDVAKVILGGSSATCSNDSLSDYDVYLLWTKTPSLNCRKKLLAHIKIISSMLTTTLGNNYENLYGCSDHVTISDLKIDFIHFQINDINEIVKSVKNGIYIDFEIILSNILNGLVIGNNTLNTHSFVFTANDFQKKIETFNFKIPITHFEKSLKRMDYLNYFEELNILFKTTTVYFFWKNNMLIHSFKNVRNNIHLKKFAHFSKFLRLIDTCYSDPSIKNIKKLDVFLTSIDRQNFT